MVVGGHVKMLSFKESTFKKHMIINLLLVFRLLVISLSVLSVMDVYTIWVIYLGLSWVLLIPLMCFAALVFMYLYLIPYVLYYIYYVSKVIYHLVYSKNNITREDIIYIIVTFICLFIVMIGTTIFIRSFNDYYIAHLGI